MAHVCKSSAYILIGPSTALACTPTHYGIGVEGLRLWFHFSLYLYIMYIPTDRLYGSFVPMSFAVPGGQGG